MNWNRKLIIPDWEKRRIRNRHEKYLRKEKRTAYLIALFVLAVLIGGVVGSTILVGGIFK